MLVVVVVARTAVVTTLCWTAITCLLSVASGRTTAVVLPALSTLSALTAEPSLRAITSGMLLLRGSPVLRLAVAALVLLSTTVLLRRRRGVAVMTLLLTMLPVLARLTSRLIRSGLATWLVRCGRRGASVGSA